MTLDFRKIVRMAFFFQISKNFQKLGISKNSQFQISLLINFQCLYTFPHRCLQSGSNSYASNDERLTLLCIYASMPLPLVPSCTGIPAHTLLVTGLLASLYLHHRPWQHKLLFQLLSALTSSFATIPACLLIGDHAVFCPLICLLLY